jgi:hypothetical protein
MSGTWRIPISSSRGAGRIVRRDRSARWPSVAMPLSPAHHHEGTGLARVDRRGSVQWHFRNHLRVPPPGGFGQMGRAGSRAEVHAAGSQWRRRALTVCRQDAGAAVQPNLGFGCDRPRRQGPGMALPSECQLDRLADLVPPPRKHRHRYHGVFAPNHKLRPAVTALAIGNVGKRRDAAISHPLPLGEGRGEGAPNRNRSRPGLRSGSDCVGSGDGGEQGRGRCAGEVRCHRVNQVLIGVSIL